MADDGKDGTTERCRECWYHGWLDTHATSGDVCCDYLLVEGQLRGCPAGDECVHFRPGKRPPDYIRRRYKHFQLVQ